MPNEPTVVVLPVSPAELRSLIREAVADALAHAGTASGPAPSCSEPARSAPTPTAALPEFLTTREAAAFLRLSVDTLERLRQRSGGPPFKRHGHRVLYPIAGLREYGSRK